MKGISFEITLYAELTIQIQPLPCRDTAQGHGVTQEKDANRKRTKAQPVSNHQKHRPSAQEGMCSKLFHT